MADGHRVVDEAGLEANQGVGEFVGGEVVVPPVCLLGTNSPLIVLPVNG